MRRRFVKPFFAKGKSNKTNEIHKMRNVFIMKYLSLVGLGAKVVIITNLFSSIGSIYEQKGTKSIAD